MGLFTVQTLIWNPRYTHHSHSEVMRSGTWRNMDPAEGRTTMHVGMCGHTRSARNTRTIRRRYL